MNNLEHANNYIQSILTQIKQVQAFVDTVDTVPKDIVDALRRADDEIDSIVEENIT